MTECTSQVDFKFVRSRRITVAFDEEHVTQDAGVMLLRQLDGRRQLTRALADALVEWRSPIFTVHSLHDLVRERVFAIAQGYEDCNDAGQLRDDPLFKAACDRGADGVPLASQPTLSRFEHRASDDLTDARKILLDRFVARFHGRRKPAEIVLDLDTTDDPTHGQQPLAFFNGHYGTHCYQHLLVTTGEGDLLWAQLMSGTGDARALTLQALPVIVAFLRAAFPAVRLSLRADAGFATPALYDFCEDLGITYVVNCGTHKVMCEKTAHLIERAEAIYREAGEIAPVQVIGELTHQAQTWRAPRRIVTKAARTLVGPDQRFLVTNSVAAPIDVYDFYSQRGQMENWIKDFKTALSSGKTSCTTFQGNDLRVLLFAVAYQLMHELRQLAPEPLRVARLETLRLRVLRVAARVKLSARRLWVHASRSHPWRDDWLAIARALVPATV
jgi:Transposase DDE domain group 1